MKNLSRAQVLDFLTNMKDNGFHIILDGHEYTPSMVMKFYDHLPAFNNLAEIFSRSTRPDG